MTLAVLCDTSVFVAGTLRGHVHHARTLPLLDSITAGTIKGVMASHSLAECYASLTSIPPPMNPAETREILQKNLMSFFKILELSQQDYQNAIDRVVEKHLRSGAIYDALIFQSAVKGKVDKLVTWNLKHFVRLGDEIQVVTPETF